MSYLGVVVEQSLRNADALREFRILATRQGQSWRIHLVVVPGVELPWQLGFLQQSMTDGNWYAHFFRGDELIVVFRDAVFHLGVNPATWAPALEAGRERGVPEEQLDFSPRTVADVQEYFGLSAPPTLTCDRPGDEGALAGC